MAKSIFKLSWSEPSSERMEGPRLIRTNESAMIEECDSAVFKQVIDELAECGYELQVTIKCKVPKEEKAPKE